MVNDFYAKTISEEIADQLDKMNSAGTFYDKSGGVGQLFGKGLNSWYFPYEWENEKFIIVIANTALLDYLRALVREGKIKECELYFIDDDHRSINMKLDKNGRCEFWPDEVDEIQGGALERLLN